MITPHRVVDWSDAYENGGYIDGAATYPERWRSAAAGFRDALGARAETDIPYDAGARQKFDLFHPEGEAKGLAMFIHGGYWKAFDKSAWSFLAAGAVARGWACALPSYTLAPEARITEITAEVAMAVSAAAGRVSGPIRLAGHSAGGHLATRMITSCSPLVDGALNRVERVISISGVHDLRPLIWTSMNDVLGLDADEAAAESPALLIPVSETRLLCWVGAGERPEFRRQAHLLANIWTGLAAETAVFEAPGRHHFNVCDDLAEPESALVSEFLAR